MKCFRHHSADAIGVCVNCGKALCKDCVRETATQKIVCSTECDAAAEATAKSFALSRRSTASGFNMMAVFLITASGVLFWYAEAEVTGQRRGFVLAMGIIFIAVGVWCLGIGRQTNAR
jgi:hypothetical protein